MADVDAGSLYDLGQFNSATLGLYVDNETTALDLIGQVLSSIGAAIVPSSLGEFQAFGLKAPTDNDAEGELTLRDLAQGGAFSFGIGPDNAGVPAWSVVLNYGKVWSILTEGQLAGIVNEDLVRRTYLASQWRQVTSENAVIKTAHMLATQITDDTLLITLADAQAEADRRLGLYGVRRDLISFPTDMDRAPYDIGDVVKVTIPRFGYDKGRPMLVVGEHIDADKSTKTLDLWGFWRATDVLTAWELNFSTSTFSGLEALIEDI